MPTRYYSVPERLALTGVCVTVAAPLYPILVNAIGMGLLCPLRTLTTIPCPMCGMTTATLSLAAGDFSGAVSANPFILALVTITILGVVLFTVRSLDWIGAPTMWSPSARKRCGQVIGVLAAASWLYQLHRFDFL